MDTGCALNEHQQHTSHHTLHLPRCTLHLVPLCSALQQAQPGRHMIYAVPCMNTKMIFPPCIYPSVPCTTWPPRCCAVHRPCHALHHITATVLCHALPSLHPALYPTAIVSLPATAPVYPALPDHNGVVLCTAPAARCTTSPPLCRGLHSP